MKNCKLCGGSLLKDFDPNCNHFEPAVPEPQMREVFLPAKNEKVWRATIRIAEGNTVWADHPLKEMAIAKAKARFETRREIREKVKAEEPVVRVTAKAKTGQRWKHKIMDRVVVLKDFSVIGDSRGAWHTKDEKGEIRRIREDILVEDYELVGKRGFEEWLDLARGTSADRRLVSAELRELGYPPKIYMPMHPERRARLCAEGTRYGVPPAVEA